MGHKIIREHIIASQYASHDIGRFGTRHLPLNIADEFKPYITNIVDSHKATYKLMQALSNESKGGKLTHTTIHNILAPALSHQDEVIKAILANEALPIAQRELFCKNLSISFYAGLSEISPEVKSYIHRAFYGSPNFPILPWKFNGYK